jgi:hypothetical protein
MLSKTTERQTLRTTSADMRTHRTVSASENVKTYMELCVRVINRKQRGQVSLNRQDLDV